MCSWIKNTLVEKETPMSNSLLSHRTVGSMFLGLQCKRVNHPPTNLKNIEWVKRNSVEHSFHNFENWQLWIMNVYEPPFTIYKKIIFKPFFVVVCVVWGWANKNWESAFFFTRLSTQWQVGIVADLTRGSSHLQYRLHGNTRTQQCHKKGKSNCISDV